jgi:endonuclease/exonuclease/phosphatase (EEP) superfamily protein YafD
MKKWIVSLLVLASTNSAFPKNKGLGDWARRQLKPADFYIPKDKDVVQDLGIQAADEELDPDSIKLLVWNMYKGDKPDWERDFNNLSNGKDILLLQEMFLNDKMKRVFDQQDVFEYVTATSFIYKEGKVRTGVANGGRVAPQRHIWFRSPGLEPVIKTPKMSLATFYKVKGQEEQLLAISIHAINFVTTFYLAQQIKEIARLIKKHKGPVIFAGDFNTWSREKTRYVKYMANRLGLHEVKFSPDTRMRTFGWPLDFIFLRGLEVRQADCHGSLDGSDHKALTAELFLK